MGDQIRIPRVVIPFYFFFFYFFPSFLFKAILKPAELPALCNVVSSTCIYLHLFNFLSIRHDNVIVLKITVESYLRQRFGVLVTPPFLLLEGRVAVSNNFTKRRWDDFKIGPRDK